MSPHVPTPAEVAEMSDAELHEWAEALLFIDWLDEHGLRDLWRDLNKPWRPPWPSSA